MKLSHHKPSYPGRKQVFRAIKDEFWCGDIVGLEDESLASERLLACVMRERRRVSPPLPLNKIRDFAAKAIQRLPAAVRSLNNPATYPVEMSRKLIALSESSTKKISQDQNKSAKRMPGSVLFWDVDTQADFIYPGGKLYVAGAEMIVPNLKNLTAWATNEGALVVSSACAHRPGDREFKQYPPHCLAGTPEQQKIPETRLSNALILPNHLGLPESLSGYQQIILEKQELDVFSNPNAEALLAKIGYIDQVFLCGVVTEICVAYTARGLLQRGYRVSIVTDAVRHLDKSAAEAFLGEAENSGATLVLTTDVLASISLRSAA